MKIAISIIFFLASCSCIKFEKLDQPSFYGSTTKNKECIKEYFDVSTRTILLMTDNGLYVSCDTNFNLVLTREFENTDGQNFHVVKTEKGLGLFNIFMNRFVENENGVLKCTGDSVDRTSIFDYEWNNKSIGITIGDSNPNKLQFTDKFIVGRDYTLFYPVNYSQRLSLEISDFFPERFCSLCSSLFLKLKDGDFLKLNPGSNEKTSLEVGYYRNENGNYVTLKLNNKYISYTPATRQILNYTRRLTKYSFFQVIINDNTIYLFTDEGYLSYENLALSLKQSLTGTSIFETTSFNIVPGNEMNSYNTPKIEFPEFYDIKLESYVFGNEANLYLDCQMDNKVILNPNFGRSLNDRLKIFPVNGSNSQFYIQNEMSQNYLTVTEGSVNCLSSSPTIIEISISSINKNGIVLKSRDGNFITSKDSILRTTKVEKEAEIFYSYAPNQYRIKGSCSVFPKGFCRDCSYLSFKTLRNTYLKDKSETNDKTVFQVYFYSIGNDRFITLRTGFSYRYLAISPVNKNLYSIPTRSKYAMFKVEAIKDKDDQITLRSERGMYLGVDTNGKMALFDSVTDNCIFVGEIKSK